ncbi:hypothetical protein CF319_g8738 [Tilletia indica]|nr:hypothetical protein CF319_g8738 [Tilletia indica]
MNGLSARCHRHPARQLPGITNIIPAGVPSVTLPGGILPTTGLSGVTDILPTTGIPGLTSLLPTATLPGVTDVNPTGILSVDVGLSSSPRHGDDWRHHRASHCPRQCSCDRPSPELLTPVSWEQALQAPVDLASRSRFQLPRSRLLSVASPTSSTLVSPRLRSLRHWSPWRHRHHPHCCSLGVPSVTLPGVVLPTSDLSDSTLQQQANHIHETPAYLNSIPWTCSAAGFVAPASHPSSIFVP